MYTVTFREMERAALSLLAANVDKKCDFTRYLKHLLAQTGVQDYLKSHFFKEGKLPIDQAQCDHQAGWRNFSLSEFGVPPNICSAHLTGKFYFIAIQIDVDTSFFVYALELPTLPTLFAHLCSRT